MRIIQIPGGTAQLRDNNEIRVRHKRLVVTAAMAAAKPMLRLEEAQKEGKGVTGIDMIHLGLSRQEVETLMEFQDAVVIATLASWSLPDALPTMDTVGDLDETLYEALSEATREQGAAMASQTDFSPTPEPGSPTAPSAGSEPQSRADQESPSSQSSPTDGASTATAASSTA